MVSRLRSVLAAGAASLTVAGCGGGGGGTPTIPTPPVAPTPVPTPAPTPAPAPTTPTIVTGGVNDTTEYRNSAGAQQANAIVAYNAGITGKGVTAAIVDTGIDTSNSEFAGRISAASASTAGNGTIKDEGGHGTAVAGVLAAARDDANVLGIAYDATLLIARTDTPGSCTATDGCKHDDNAIARGVDLAVANNARVINISLGGSPPNSMLQASLARATSAGIVVVISAGNDAESEPDELALVANNDAVAHGLILIAGATDSTGALASFSNLAGSGANHYIAALGSRVRSFDQTGAQFLYSGTSFSAPLVAGAVALLAQAFPNLTGAQIVSLLLSSADDLGTAGVDSTYGYGRLDLVKAFAPRGATSLAGSTAAISLSDNAMLSAPMGDAGSQRAAGAIILDSYGRAYALDLGATLHHAAAPPRLSAALAGGTHSLSIGTGATFLAMSITRNAASGVDVGRLTLARSDAALARATAGMIASRIGATRVALAFGRTGADVADELAGTPSLPFLVAGAPGEAGFASHPDASVAVSRPIGPATTLDVFAEHGTAQVPTPPSSLRASWQGYGFDRFGIATATRLGPVTIGAGASRLRESATTLGARFSAALGGGGATSDFVDLDVGIDGPGHWRLTGKARRGWTRGTAGGAATSGARLTTSAFALDLSHAALLLPHDVFAVRVSQPLRVDHGGTLLALPVGYDYGTGVTATTLSRLDLAPHGRELDVETAWGMPLGPGWLATNVYWRREPGNFATAPADLGAAVRYGFSF